jgi:hypothetical protein
MRCTMVMTKFAAEVLLRFLASGLTSDKSKDLYYSKVDQLPSFDLSLLFSNESGWASYQRVLGVEFVTSADIYSIQDMLTEQSVSYLATDITPLLPLNFSSFYRLGEQTDKTRSLRPMKPKPLARGREMDQDQHESPDRHVEGADCPSVLNRCRVGAYRPRCRYRSQRIGSHLLNAGVVLWLLPWAFFVPCCLSIEEENHCWPGRSDTKDGVAPSSARRRPRPAGFTSCFVRLAVPARLHHPRPFRPCAKSTLTSRGTYVSQTSTATYSAKLKFHGDNALLGISTQNRELQENKENPVPSNTSLLGDRDLDALAGCCPQHAPPYPAI